jgi:hypothetical protein
MVPSYGSQNHITTDDSQSVLIAIQSHQKQGQVDFHEQMPHDRGLNFHYFCAKLSFSCMHCVWHWPQARAVATLAPSAVDANGNTMAGGSEAFRTQARVEVLRRALIARLRDRLRDTVCFPLSEIPMLSLPPSEISMLELQCFGQETSRSPRKFQSSQTVSMRPSASNSVSMCGHANFCISTLFNSATLPTITSRNSA